MMVRLSVDHISPSVAQKWSLWIAKEANSMVADLRIQESQDSIKYLQEQISKTPYAELRTLFYELIQQKTQNMMLAKVNSEFVLTTIDPPLIPEIKSAPSRALFVILFTILGFIVAVSVVFFRNYIFAKA